MVIFSVSPGPTILLDGKWMESGRQARSGLLILCGRRAGERNRLPSPASGPTPSTPRCTRRRLARVGALKCELTRKRGPAMARSSIVPRPAVAIVAQAAGDRLPSYVTREQARAIINAAATATHRLLLEALWQSGGRVTEVLRLRPCDLDPGAPILHLVNLKQRPQRGGHRPRKAVIVSPDLLAACEPWRTTRTCRTRATSSARARATANRCPTATAGVSSAATRLRLTCWSWARMGCPARLRAGTSATERPSTS